jgi:acyl carrier protein
MTDLRSDLRRYIEENFLLGTRATPLADSDSFLEQHVLDSTGFLELIAYLEETCAIRVGDEEMIPDNLDSIDAVVAFVTRKRES